MVSFSSGAFESHLKLDWSHHENFISRFFYEWNHLQVIFLCVESLEQKYSQYVPKFLLLSYLRTKTISFFPRKIIAIIPGNGARKLALYKLCSTEKMNDRGNLQTNFEAEN
jgi:hypothetical protein